MRKNGLIPYGIIAVVGIIAIIIISFVGLNQQKEIQQAAESGEAGEQVDEGAVATDAEAIFQKTCASCHGSDLSGGLGPDLQQVGSKYSEDEIKEIIAKGFPDSGMPPGLAQGAEAEALAKWLGEKK